MSKLPNPLEHRSADHPVESLFVRRWSPRAMSGEALSDAEIGILFEAARWAASAYNEQEWRFLTARRDGAHWGTFFDLLVEGNQVWCKQAGVLVVVLSHKVFERNGKANHTHSLDTGMAMGNLLLQASHMGLVAHGMVGFDREKARADLKVPDEYEVEAMIALGRPGDPADLPDTLRAREVPSGRKPISEFVCEGGFGFPRQP